MTYIIDPVIERQERAAAICDTFMAPSEKLMHAHEWMRDWPAYRWNAKLRWVYVRFWPLSWVIRALLYCLVIIAFLVTFAGGMIIARLQCIKEGIPSSWD